MFLLVYEFDKGCSLILSTAPVLLIPICANNVAIESRVQYMFPLPARHVSNDWTGEKKLGQLRGAIYSKYGRYQNLATKWAKSGDNKKK